MVRAGLGLIAILMALASPAAGQSGLPIPRFVTIDADPANMRAGPGESYPIRWIYQRRHWPVEVIGEHDNWRRVRDIDGEEGWIFHALLSGRRAIVVETDNLLNLFSQPEADSPVVARVEPGASGWLLRCPAADTVEGDWCFIDFEGTRGWMPRTVLYGVYPFEEVQ